MPQDTETMTSTTFKIIIAVAAVAGQLLFVGTQPAEAQYSAGRVIRDHRANPTPWKLPSRYHNHKTTRR
jgi:hypothetical protein